MTGPDNDDVAEMELKAKQDMQRAAISSAVMVEDAAIAYTVNLPDGDSAVAMAIGDLGAIKTQLATTKTERDAKVPASLRAAAIGSALAGTYASSAEATSGPIRQPFRRSRPLRSCSSDHGSPPCRDRDSCRGRHPETRLPRRRPPGLLDCCSGIVSGAPRISPSIAAGSGPVPKEVPVQPGQVRLRTPADEGRSAHELPASARPRIATRCCRGASSPHRSFRCAAASERIPRCRQERGSHASRPTG